MEAAQMKRVGVISTAASEKEAKPRKQQREKQTKRE